MTTLDYAKLCAGRYRHAGKQKIKGRGHAPRVLLDRHHALQKLLPAERITSRDPDGNYVASWYASKEVFDWYAADLLAAGIDIISGDIVSEPHWLAAQAVARLTGQPLDSFAALALAAEVREQLERFADDDLRRSLSEGSL